MSTWTKNLELLKPDVTDPVSPQPFNQNNNAIKDVDTLSI